MPRELLRKLPQIEKVLQWPGVEALIAVHSRPEVLRVLRSSLAELRSVLLEERLDGDEAESLVAPEALLEAVRRELERRALSGYRRVINGTGILLHTGLGRAVLPAAAREAFREQLSGYSLVEVDVERGERSQREAALRELLSELTGAPAATAVNNNAAAILLILAAIARGKEVILSRGQMVEIGGSFRVPEILAESGARLVEVGTTNRTYLRDYRKALGPETGLILQVHTSNYEIRGFACHTPLEELVALGREHGVPVASDLGSGCLIDLAPWGYRREPLVSDAVRAGADLVSFSGDKLLGGPQAGVIAGSEEAIARLRAHPLFRPLRVDKAALVLLEATLRLYRDPERAAQAIPILRQLRAGAAEIRERARRFLERLDAAGRGSLETEIVETRAETGSGSLPAQEIPSFALALRHPRRGAQELAQVLRSATPPVFSRLEDGRVLLDFRSILPEDEADLLKALAGLRSSL
jgi:L-seryl-tRNA(Ser) seleniumtransferase